MRIAHLSDPHFGTEVPEVVAALRMALLAARPQLIVVSGDITQRARAVQFDAAAAFMDSLPPVPKLLVPGNHDLPLFNLPMRLLMPDHGYRRVFGAPVQERRIGQVAVLGFDTTLRTRHTRGDLDISHLLARMARVQDAALRVVVLHQPLHTTLPQDRDECLLHAAPIAEALAGSGADLVLSGHVHMPLLADTRAIFPGLQRHFVLSGAGTAVSSRIRSGAPNSFNLVEMDSQALQIQLALHAFDPERGTFLPDICQSYRRGPDGWQQLRSDENSCRL